MNSKQALDNKLVTQVYAGVQDDLILAADS